ATAPSSRSTTGPASSPPSAGSAPRSLATGGSAANAYAITPTSAAVAATSASSANSTGPLGRRPSMARVMRSSSLDPFLVLVGLLPAQARQEPDQNERGQRPIVKNSSLGRIPAKLA